MSVCRCLQKTCRQYRFFSPKSIPFSCLLQKVSVPLSRESATSLPVFVCALCNGVFVSTVSPAAVVSQSVSQMACGRTRAIGTQGTVTQRECLRLSDCLQKVGSSRNTCPQEPVSAKCFRYRTMRPIAERLTMRRIVLHP